MKSNWWFWEKTLPVQRTRVQERQEIPVDLLRPVFLGHPLVPWVLEDQAAPDNLVGPYKNSNFHSRSSFRCHNLRYPKNCDTFLQAAN